MKGGEYSRMRNGNMTALYYEGGALLYVGTLKRTGTGTEFDEGIAYRENGVKLAEGVFQRGGLLRGNWYYPDGQLMFSGEYNVRDGEEGHYYGPPYPKCGRLYSETGELIYDGRVKIRHNGGVGYPFIVLPDGLIPAPGLPKIQ